MDDARHARPEPADEAGATPPAKQPWIPPAVTELPRLTDLTLQTGGSIRGGGDTGGGGSTVF